LGSTGRCFSTLLRALAARHLGIDFIEFGVLDEAERSRQTEERLREESDDETYYLVAVLVGEKVL